MVDLRHSHRHWAVSDRITPRQIWPNPMKPKHEVYCLGKVGYNNNTMLRTRADARGGTGASLRLLFLLLPPGPLHPAEEVHGGYPLHPAEGEPRLHREVEVAGQTCSWALMIF